MTVILSLATESFVAVAADSAVTLTFQDSTRRERGRKLTVLPRAFIARWGELTGDPVPRWLTSLTTEVTSSAEQLAVTLQGYLRNTDRPGDHGLGHLGYHVGGADSSGRMRLFNVSWEPAGTLPDTPPSGNYGFYDHSPSGNVALLYNGRNDLGEVAVRALIEELHAGRETQFAIRTPPGALRFADFVVRFAAELTPDVGPPIHLALIPLGGVAFTHVHRYLRPLPRSFEKRLRAHRGRAG